MDSNKYPDQKNSRRTIGGLFGTDHAKIEFGERERRKQRGETESAGYRHEVRGPGPEESAWESVMNFFGIGPKGYRRSDQSLFEDVCETLSRHSGVDARDIEVKVKDGLVILMGSVPSRRMKRLAEDCLDDVSGVTDVQNQLRVADNSTLASSSAASPQSTSGSQTSSSPEKMQ